MPLHRHVWALGIERLQVATTRDMMCLVFADASDKTMIVTGANSGIGKQIALNLAAAGAQVVMACRSTERGQAALEDIQGQVSNAQLHLMQLDQSSQRSIRDFAQEFESRFDRLDVLVNNAGIYPQSRVLSVDDIESTWATNVMGYFLLSKLLQTTLAKSRPSRLLFVASQRAGGLDLEDLQWERRRFGGIKAYEASKQANRMLGWVFAERLKDSGIDVNVIHPGGINTGIGRSQKGLWGFVVRQAFKTQKPVSEGADTATWLATAPELEGQTGKFWDRRRERECEFRDMAQCRALWTLCEDLIKEAP